MKAMVALVALSAATFAQEPNPRYEFLWRLRQVEARWKSFSTTERAKAAGFAATAQSQLASGAIGACCEALDHAAGATSNSVGGNDSIAIIPARRLCDRTETELGVKLAREYRATTNAVITFSADARETELALDDFWFLGHSGPWGSELSVDRLGLGDHTVTLGLFDGDFDSSTRTMTLSVAEHRDERLAKLKADIEKLGDKAPALERETAKATLALLESLAHGSTEAHEYPGARLLEETEQVVAAAAKGERWYTPQRSGEFWLSLPIDGASVRTRVLVPEELSKEKTAPLVLAFHGAAFDEDVWFDGYGGGAAVEACRKRGWIFAAMHCEGEDSAKRVEAVIDALAGVYPVDAKRVFLVGHSRGARAALRAQAANPERYHGVAAIGNALDDASAKALVNRPLFLAAGDRDPAREAVTAMHKALTDAGSKTVKLTICPSTEHWLAVQAALPDAFAWFDSLAK